MNNLVNKFIKPSAKSTVATAVRPPGSVRPVEHRLSKPRRPPFWRRGTLVLIA